MRLGSRLGYTREIDTCATSLDSVGILYCNEVCGDAPSHNWRSNKVSVAAVSAAYAWLGFVTILVAGTILHLLTQTKYRSFYYQLRDSRRF